MAASKSIGADIKRREAGSPFSEHYPKGWVISDGGRRHTMNPAPRVLSEEYEQDFFSYIASKGQQVSAALYEGAGSAGGYTVPSMVDGQIVPLAPTDTGVRTIATVFPNRDGHENSRRHNNQHGFGKGGVGRGNEPLPGE